MCSQKVVRLPICVVLLWVARRHGIVVLGLLLVDRLADRKVDFVACDMPSANAFVINVYAAAAQEERRMISDRTKAGLAAAKARGVKLGGPRLPAINETRQADALERARAIAPILSELTGMSARAVAAELNARQVETPSGAPWSAKTVIRARERLI